MNGSQDRDGMLPLNGNRIGGIASDSDGPTLTWQRVGSKFDTIDDGPPSPRGGMVSLDPKPRAEQPSQLRRPQQQGTTTYHEQSTHR